MTIEKYSVAVVGSIESMIAGCTQQREQELVVSLQDRLLQPAEYPS